MSTTPTIAPDPSKIVGAVTVVGTQSAPFIPAKVRAIIYAGGSALSATLEAVSPVIGGTVGLVLQISGAAIGAFVGAVAISHVTGS